MWGTAAGVFMVIGAIYDVAEQQRVARRAIDEIVRREVFTSYEQITGENGEELDKELGLPRDSERASS